MKRWRPRMSVKGLFVMTAFCAVLVAWWMDHVVLKRTADELRSRAERSDLILQRMWQEFTQVREIERKKSIRQVEASEMSRLHRLDMQSEIQRLDQEVNRLQRDLALAANAETEGEPR